MILMCFTLVLFSTAALMNPGYIKLDAIQKKKQAAKNEIKIEPIQIDPHCRFCTSCEMWQTLRAKHCRACKQCVAMYDHHCIWMGNCIGERNHAVFWWFLFSETILTAWTIYEIVLSFESGSDTQDTISRNLFAIL